jgi:outer membrane protein assembly factor BamB
MRRDLLRVQVAAVLLLVSCAGCARTHAGGGRAYSDRSDEPALAWSVDARRAGDILGVVAGDDGFYASTYITERRLDVMAVRAQDGSTRWRTHVPFQSAWGSALITRLTVNEGVVLVSDQFGDRWALDAATGAQLWAAISPRRSRQDSRGPGIVSAGKALTCDPYLGTLECRDARSGGVVWTARAPTEACHWVAPSASGLLLATRGGALVCYDPASGRQRWSTRVMTWCSQLVSADPDRVVVGGDRVCMVDVATRKVVWTIPRGLLHWTSARTLCTSGDQTFLVTADGSLCALRSGDGSLQWEASLRDRAGQFEGVNSDLSVGQWVAVAAFSPSGRTLRVFSRTGQPVTQIALFLGDSGASVAESGGYLSAFDSKRGLECWDLRSALPPAR